MLRGRATTVIAVFLVVFLCIGTPNTITAQETATDNINKSNEQTCTATKTKNGKEKGDDSWFDFLAQDPKLFFQQVFQDQREATATATASVAEEDDEDDDDDDDDDDSFRKLDREHDTSDDTNPKQQDFLQNLWSIFRNDIDNNRENKQLLTDMIQQELDHANQNDRTTWGSGDSAGLQVSISSIQKILELYGNSTDAVLRQLKDTFHVVSLDRFDPLQVFYYMQHEEQVKNAVWKRQQHRYLPRLKTSVAIQLADGLYLSHLSYVDTVSDVKEGLAAFKNNAWKLLFATTDSQPYQPAHFVAIHRELAPLQHHHHHQRVHGGKHWGNTNPFENKQNSEQSHKDLHVTVVVRGTKGLGDFFSNGLLSLTDYMGGKAHDGILKSACWLVNQTVPRLQQLLQQTGRQKVQLWLVGHSLGAGAAALAALEFNAHHADWVQAHSLGFGTPALVTPNVSIAAKHVVRTVINDADVVPRMSGGKLVKAWMAIVAHNWTDQAEADMEQLMGVWKANNYLLPFENLLSQQAVQNFQDWLKDALINPKIIETTTTTSIVDDKEKDLIPPGTCIHLYRDGVSWQGADTPCSFFSELEVVRHMLDDHLIDTGYYRGLLSFVREQEKNWDWQFEHNLLQLPV
jgi:hypothetical protein